MKKMFVLLLLLVLGLGNAWSATTESPRELVEEAARQLLNALRENRQALEKEPGLVYDLVDDFVLPYFDFEAMSRYVLGKYWRQATPEQQKRFVEEFRTLLVRTYANALLDYSNENVRVPPMPSVPDDADRVKVRAEIVPPSGQPIPIDYSMYLKDGTWKVYDVSVDGPSLVITYRSEFDNQIRKCGIDCLIDKLEERNAEAAGKS